LLAAGGLYASMWNRQREAEEAREKLAQVGDSTPPPHPELSEDSGEVGPKDGPDRLPLLAPNAAE
jgi:ATP-binding cassette subfamily B protein